MELTVIGCFFGSLSSLQHDLFEYDCGRFDCTLDLSFAQCRFMLENVERERKLIQLS